MKLMRDAFLNLIITTSGLIAEASNTNTFEVEIDPLAYILGGASGHVAYTWKNERIQLGLATLDIPKAMQDNAEVSESFKAVSLKWDYFIGRSNPSKGFFVGLTSDYLFLSYKDDQGDEVNKQKIASGLRLGYKFNLFRNHKSFKGLYVTPWLGTSYLFNNDRVQLSGTNYSLKTIKVFPTIHMGWSF